MNFNPRAYVRHDYAGHPSYPRDRFQSTCLREARLSGERVHGVLQISIHVPT